MLGWVGPVNTTTAQRVGCDADVTVVAVGGPDGAGGAREVERTRRFFTTAQRVAMIARDGDRCAVPYCDRPVLWSDAHHLQAWANGGPTVIDNGALPCAAHHTMLHEGHWTLHRDRRRPLPDDPPRRPNHRTRTPPTRTQPPTPTTRVARPRANHLSVTDRPRQAVTRENRHYATGDGDRLVRQTSRLRRRPPNALDEAAEPSVLTPWVEPVAGRTVATPHGWLTDHRAGQHGTSGCPTEQQLLRDDSKPTLPTGRSKADR